MSRRTSDIHDKLSQQRGFGGGKSTTFKADEPGFTLDYNDAYAARNQWSSQGYRRYLDLVANGAQPARGASANNFGWVLGSAFGPVGVSVSGDAGRFAALLLPESQGLSVWGPVAQSGDAFQHQARGGDSGMTTDADDGWLCVEDQGNPTYSIVFYKRFGLITKDRMVSAFTLGLVQREMAARYADVTSDEDRRRIQDQKDAEAQRARDQAAAELQAQYGDLDAQLALAKKKAELAAKKAELDRITGATNAPPPPGVNTGAGTGPVNGLEVYATVNDRGTTFDTAINVQTGAPTAGAKFFLLGYDAGDDQQGYKLAAGPARQLGEQKFPGQSPQTYGLPAWVATQTTTGPRLLTAAVMNSLFGTSWKR